MSTHRVTGIGKQDQQDAFLARHAEFFARIEHLLAVENAAFDRTLQASGFTNPVIFYLGIRSVQDFNAIALLAANGDALPALALVRGMYERVVTAAYLHEHPAEAEAFAEYDYVQRYKVARRIKEAVPLTTAQAEQFDELRTEYERVRERFLVTDCAKCKTTSVGPSWSKLSFVAMAGQVPPLDALLVPAYYDPLAQAHSTLHSITSVLSAANGDLEFRKDYTAQADETFHLAYLLLMHVFKIQAQHFQLADLDTALERAITDYVALYPNE
jgi:hypothetical protein